MTVTFSGKVLYAQIQRRIVAGLNATAEQAESIAVEKAPVRKVFKGGAGRASPQSGVEVKAEAAMRRKMGLAAGPVRTQRTAASAVHSTMSLRQLARPGQLANAGPTLTARGRYELKAGRANFKSAGGATLGGRLRGEIHVVPAEGGGTRWTARVVSPTGYAKYVEFGTRHARAQPYLRPALAQVRESFRERMAAAVRGRS
jgi:HK97 gp10 family phage protein